MIPEGLGLPLTPTVDLGKLDGAPERLAGV